MDNLTDHNYFKWLNSQIDIPNGRTYKGLFTRMHDTEFVWFVPNDDNRVYDGLALRTEFHDGTVGWEHSRILKLRMMTNKGASVFEVLIALARRTAFICEGEPSQWAWKLIENLGLDRFPDPLNDRQVERIDEILDTLVWRTYERNGEGGFFPLQHPEEDQTKIEIWYQMNAYAMELYKS